MITGMRFNIRRPGLLILVGLLLPAQCLVAAETNTLSLDALMQLMKKTPDPSVSYTEEKTSDFLDMNLISKGSLSLDESGVLEKTVVGSVATSRMVVTETELQIIRPDKEIKSISLQRYPVIKAFLAAFKATLQGDLAELQKYYSVELSGGIKNWHLNLVPSDEILAKAVKSVQIYGSNGKTLKYIIEESRGDTSTLLIGEELL